MLTDEPSSPQGSVIRLLTPYYKRSYAKAIAIQTQSLLIWKQPETLMTTATIATPKKEEPLLFEELTWREFKAVEQLLDRPGYRLSFLMEYWRFDGCQENLTNNKGKDRCIGGIVLAHGRV
jgi:hypothetical protein